MLPHVIVRILLELYNNITYLKFLNVVEMKRRNNVFGTIKGRTSTKNERIWLSGIFYN